MLPRTAAQRTLTTNQHRQLGVVLTDQDEDLAAQTSPFLGTFSGFPLPGYAAALQHATRTLPAGYLHEPAGCHPPPLTNGHSATMGPTADYNYAAAR
jgi:hypothetical protein